MEFHAITDKGSTHILTIHQDEKDEGPLHFISTQRLARLEKMAAAMDEMMGRDDDAAGADST